MTDVTETDKGRVRQLIVTLVLAGLLTTGLMLFLWYGGHDGEATKPIIWYTYVIGIVVLGINYINDNVLLQLVMRVPLPSKLKGE